MKKREKARRSVVWRLPKEKFQKVVSSCDTLADVLRYFNLYSAGNYPTLKKRIKEENINVSHMSSGLNSRKGKIFPRERRPVEEYLVKKDEKISGPFLKKKLFDSGLLKEECSECKIGNIWNGKHISLNLDHINGDHMDNRLENLRILCPNCHSQTPTFSGKHRHPKTKCANCGIVISKHSTKCRLCSNKTNPKPTKIEWPTAEDLFKLIWEKPTTHIAKTLGVSDKAIEKHIKKLGLTKPPRGYWSKIAAGKN